MEYPGQGPDRHRRNTVQPGDSMDKKDSEKRDEEQPPVQADEAPETERPEAVEETDEASEAADRDAPEAESDTAAGGVSRAAFGFWIVLVVLVLLAAGAAGGWYLWQQIERQQAMIEQQQAADAGLESDLATLGGDIASNRSAVEALASRAQADRQKVEDSLSGRQDELAERQDQLSARLARIDDRLSRGEIAWKTAEIGFLLTRAQERLVISRDPEGAVTALELADERLAALSRPHWLPLRSAISDALGELEAAGEADRVGQALTMRRLAEGVENWPLVGRDDEAASTADAPAETSTTEPPADAAWYERAWADVTGWVGSQVTVTRSDRPVRLRERVATDREMRLWITAVRESLLARDHGALRTTVTEAEEWLNSHYAVDAEGPAKALSALASVRERFAARDFPALDTVFEAWHKGSKQQDALSAESPGKEADR